MPEQEPTPTPQGRPWDAAGLSPTVDPVGLAEDVRDLAATLIQESSDSNYKARVEAAMERTCVKLAEQGQHTVAGMLKL